MTSVVGVRNLYRLCNLNSRYCGVCLLCMTGGGEGSGRYRKTDGGCVILSCAAFTEPQHDSGKLGVLCLSSFMCIHSASGLLALSGSRQERRTALVVGYSCRPERRLQFHNNTLALRRSRCEDISNAYYSDVPCIHGCLLVSVCSIYFLITVRQHRRAIRLLVMSCSFRPLPCQDPEHNTTARLSLSSLFTAIRSAQHHL